MESGDRLKVEALIKAPIEKVWAFWTNSEHIKGWNNASDDWHTPHVENDLQDGGKFVYRMEAKDGSFGFDFGGTYEEVRPLEYIEYVLGDGRMVSVEFEDKGNQTRLTERFEPENSNPREIQRTGWQSILDNFKRYCETVQFED
jgi:uncharacterized protein YndB with AHSA1/START domain